MSWKEVTPMSERLDLCRLATGGGYSISELARRFGVSRKTAYKWLDRYEEHGDNGVFDKSRRPENSPSHLSQEVVNQILELKGQYPMWGPRKLHNLLKRSLGNGACSRSSVDRTLARHGLRDRREPRPVEEAVGSFERKEPNDLWQIDFKAPFVLPGGARVWAVPILDDHSRYCVNLCAAPNCTAKYALNAFRLAASEYGLPSEILSDHGSAFGVARSYVSEFTGFMWACGVDHTQGRYAHPQTQGKLERFNQTLQRECISQHSYENIDDWNKAFEEYRHIYNHIRPHQSLCDSVPASRYKASGKAFVEPDRSLREPGHDVAHRKVDCSGKIWLLQHHIRVGAGLAGWTVSARHDGAGIWTISFRGHSICQVGLTKPAQYKPKR